MCSALGFIHGDAAGAAGEPLQQRLLVHCRHQLAVPGCCRRAINNLSGLNMQVLWYDLPVKVTGQACQLVQTAGTMVAKHLQLHTGV